MQASLLNDSVSGNSEHNATRNACGCQALDLRKLIDIINVEAAVGVEIIGHRNHDGSFATQ